VSPFSDALAEGTIFMIVRELRDVQAITEKQLQQSYDDMLLNQDRQRRNLQHQAAMGSVLGRDWHIVSWFISGPIDLLSLIDSTH
jgi:hypothetical protein